MKSYLKVLVVAIFIAQVFFTQNLQAEKNPARDQNRILACKDCK